MRRWLWVSNQVLEWVAIEEDESIEFFTEKYKDFTEGDLILVYKTSPHKKMTHLLHVHPGEYIDSLTGRADDKIKFSSPIHYNQVEEIFSSWMKRPRKGLHEIPDHIWDTILTLILKNNPLQSQTVNSFIGESLNPGELDKYYKQALKLVSKGEMVKAIKYLESYT